MLCIFDQRSTPYLCSVRIKSQVQLEVLGPAKACGNTAYNLRWPRGGSRGEEMKFCDLTSPDLGPEDDYVEHYIGVILENLYFQKREPGSITFTHFK